MTTLLNLTEKQKQILRFIYQQIQTNRLPPTLREIAAEFKFSSPRSAQDHLKALVKKGFIRISQKKSRAIELVREHLFSIPVIGKVQAGLPTLAMENIEGYLNLDKLVFSDQGIFGLRVKGDSMVGAGIMPGDLIVVRQQASAETGQIVVALINDEATVKTLSKNLDQYVLAPANPNYEPIPLTDDVSILGVVQTVVRQV